LVFRSFVTVISFLTIIPITKWSSSDSDISQIAKNMYLFPLVGIIIGILIGGLAYEVSFYLRPALVGLLVTCALIIITGVNHMDGLADFADGLMANGNKEAKHNAMLDPAVGSAGVAAVVLYIIGMIIAISSFHYGLKLLTGIIVAEVIAKYAMVLQAYRGLSAWEGFSVPFTISMKDSQKMLASTGIMLPIVLVIGSYVGLVALGVSLVITMVMQYTSNKIFGGISGDMLGALNEITRLSSLIVLSSVTIL